MSSTPTSDQERAMTDEQIKHMVNRFLAWRLPEDFAPDGGITATRANYGPGVEWTPCGTNLLTAAQAEAMVRYMIEGMPHTQLYRALRDLVDEIETDGGIDTSEWPILDAARAALAKASPPNVG